MKPMLSATCEDINFLSYPVLASPKLDGIRALVLDGQLVSRNLKPIRNVFTREQFSIQAFEGLDGELILGDHDSSVFRRTTSAVSRSEGEPDVTFHVFDVYGLTAHFHDRYTYLRDHFSSEQFGLSLKVVPHTRINSARELHVYEENRLNEGYEGVMIRSLGGPYKEGRSTVREGYLLKLKRFEDAEAEVIGFEERMHNGNAEATNALGHTERSSHQENLSGRGDLGALVVRGLNGPYAGVEFRIGTGFDDLDRREIWCAQGMYIGQTCKYKFFPQGSKGAPRFPVFLGWRMGL